MCAEVVSRHAGGVVLTLAARSRGAQTREAPAWIDHARSEHSWAA